MLATRQIFETFLAAAGFAQKSQIFSIFLPRYRFGGFFAGFFNFFFARCRLRHIVSREQMNRVDDVDAFIAASAPNLSFFLDKCTRMRKSKLCESKTRSNLLVVDQSVNNLR